MDFKTFFLNTATLLIVLDPVGIIPIVQSLLLPVPRKRRMHVLRRELFIVLALLLMFYFAGEAILNYMEIDQSTLSISGGILLLLIAVGMVFPRVDVLGSSPEHDSKNSEPLLVPIAVPIIVGPASISVVMIMAAKCADATTLLFNSLSVVAAWAVAFTVLMFTRKIAAKMGQRGAVALTRLMGTILVLLAIQMCLNGLTKYIDAVRHPAPAPVEQVEQAQPDPAATPQHE